MEAYKDDPNKSTVLLEKSELAEAAATSAFEAATAGLDDKKTAIFATVCKTDAASGATDRVNAEPVTTTFPTATNRAALDGTHDASATNETSEWANYENVLETVALEPDTLDNTNDTLDNTPTGTATAFDVAEPVTTTFPTPTNDTSELARTFEKNTKCGTTTVWDHQLNDQSQCGPNDQTSEYCSMADQPDEEQKHNNVNNKDENIDLSNESGIGATMSCPEQHDEEVVFVKAVEPFIFCRPLESRRKFANDRIAILKGPPDEASMVKVEELLLEQKDDKRRIAQ